MRSIIHYLHNYSFIALSCWLSGCYSCSKPEGNTDACIEQTDTETDSDSDTGTDSDTNTEIDSDTDTGTDLDTDTGTDTDINNFPGLTVVKQTATGASGLGLQDYYGSSVANIGDIDGDDIPDIMVGAPGDDDSASGAGTNNGAVYIQFMRADGTVKEYTKLSNLSGGASGEGFGGVIPNYADFGSSVTGIGDINGDNVPDVAVGAPFDDYYKGAVWILMLNDDGTVADYFTIRDDIGTAMEGLLEGYSAFGASLAKLEDLLGGVKLAVGAYADIVGCTEVDNKQTCGAIWTMDVYADGTVETIKRIGMGSENNPDLPLEAKDYFGYAMSSLCDFNGDSVADLIVSAVGDDDGGDGKGAVYLLMMNSSGAVDSFMKISDTSGKFIAELGDDNFGYSVCGLEDVDGDDVLDIAVGVPEYDDGKGGYWILLLNEDGTVKNHVLFSDGTAGITLGTFYEDDMAGSALTMADLDTTDGVFDIVVGAKGYSISEGTTWTFRTKAPVQKVQDIPSVTVAEGEVKMRYSLPSARRCPRPCRRTCAKRWDL